MVAPPQQLKSTAVVVPSAPASPPLPADEPLQTKEQQEQQKPVVIENDADDVNDDEDSSTSSITTSGTSSVNNLVSSDNNSSNADPNKKSVRFDFGLNTTVVFEQDETVPPTDIWYIGDDYTDMKYSSRQTAKEFRRAGFGILLQDTFACPKSNAQECINAYVRFEESQSRRGLERNLSRPHGEERSELKDRARQSVLIHQRRLRRDGYKYDEMSVKLSAMYRDVCKSAAAFARRMAVADELVAREGVDSTIACVILEACDIPVNGMNGQNQRRRGVERRMSQGSLVSTNSYDSTHAYYLRQAEHAYKRSCAAASAAAAANNSAPPVPTAISTVPLSEQEHQNHHHPHYRHHHDNPYHPHHPHGGTPPNKHLHHPHHPPQVVVGGGSISRRKPVAAPPSRRGGYSTSPGEEFYAAIA